LVKIDAERCVAGRPTAHDVTVEAYCAAVVHPFEEEGDAPIAPFPGRGERLPIGQGAGVLVM